MLLKLLRDNSTERAHAEREGGHIYSQTASDVGRFLQGPVVSYRDHPAVPTPLQICQRELEGFLFARDNLQPMKTISFGCYDLANT